MGKKEISMRPRCRAQRSPSINKMAALVTLVAALLIGAGCAQGQPHNPIRVVLTAARAVFPAHSAVDVTLEVQNVSNEIVTLPPHLIPQYYWFRFEVLDAAGNAVAYQGPENKLFITDHRVDLLLGYFLGRTLDLAKLFPLKSGRYRVRAVYETRPAIEISKMPVTLVGADSPWLNIEVR